MSLTSLRTSFFFQTRRLNEAHLRGRLARQSAPQQLLREAL